MTETQLMAESGFYIPRPQISYQRLIISLFGLYSRTPGAVLPVAALVSLLNDLGYDEPGVRSAISRLKSKGTLRAAPVGQVAAYELKESLQATFIEGDERIFAERVPQYYNGWVLALFSVPETQRSLRHQLRKVLSGLGFGTAGAGVWIANGRFLGQAQKRLDEQGLLQYVEFFRGDYFFEGSVRDQVSQWWDLEGIDEILTEFLSEYGDAEDIWVNEVGSDPATAFREATTEQCRDAFRYYIPMLSQWRRVPYRDPNLPDIYMPEGWKEPQARKTFVQVHRLISPLAARHARQVIRTYLPEHLV